MWQYKFQAPLGFGSRQEEAQGLGRTLRPREDASPAFFYTLVSKDTKDQDFGAKRQLFLTEQGYRYVIRDEFMDNEDEGKGY
jgi:DNA excision repair protein ERCC-3